MSQLLIVFARYPEVGKCKTRLIPHVGPQVATELHAAMTRFTLAWATEAAKHADTCLQVHFAGGDQESMRREFGSSLDYVPQCSGDLGGRLRAAVEQAAKQGFAKVVVVGTDCPQLSCDLARQALTELDHHDVCLSPATDGGYTLLGVRADPSNSEQIYDALFENISWGSSDVLRETLSGLGQTSARVRLLQTLSDVDCPDDLPLWEQAQASTGPPRPKLSIVIPVFGREARLARVLDSVGHSPSVEIIIAAADSEPESLQVAAEYKAQFIVGTRWRSKQMNQGASVARGETLMFLHADTVLPPGYMDAIRSCLEDDGCVGGAFRLGIDSDRRSARFIEWGVDLRSRWLRLPYGDQAIFVRGSVFRELNGFSDQPIMEDYDFVKRMRKLGQIAICGARVATSPRRWHQVGFLKTTLLNQWIIAAYRMGVSPQRLARLYRRKK